MKLNEAFKYGLQEYPKFETQVQFHATLPTISAAFNGSYLKWLIDGLGEAYGFWFHLKANSKPFIVFTLVNIEGLDDVTKIEWMIDAESLETAMDVVRALNFDQENLVWKKGDT
jgi:hypothetical protein